MFWIFILIWIVEEMSTELKNMNKSSRYIIIDRTNKFNDETDWELFRNEDERFR